MRPDRRSGYPGETGRDAGRDAGTDAAIGGGVLAALDELLAGESAESRRFLGGLVAGALLGAIVAGSAVLGRRRGSTAAGDRVGRGDGA